MSEDPGSNNEVHLKRISEDITERINRAKTASRTSLQDFREIGQRLTEAKRLLKGNYLKWAEEKLGFKRQWCANLTKLAASWSVFEEAEQANKIGENDYSVDAALKAIRKSKAESEPPKDQPEKPKRKTAAELNAELEQLRHELAKAKAELIAKQAEIDDLKSQFWTQAHTTSEDSANDVQSTGHAPDPATSRGERRKAVASMSGAGLTPVTDAPLNSRGVEQKDEPSAVRGKPSYSASAQDEAARDGSAITPELAEA